MVSVQYATIVPMTDADIARDDVSRDARRCFRSPHTVRPAGLAGTGSRSLLRRSSSRLRSHLTERGRPGSLHRCSRS